MKILLRYSPDLKTRDMYGSTPIHWAAELGDAVMFNLLLSQVAWEPEDYSDFLPTACYGGNKVIIDMILGKGGSFDAMNAKFGPNLHAAAWGGHEAVVLLLLDNGVGTDSIGGKYGTALQAAAYHGHVTVISLLLDQRNADVNIQSGLHGNALQAAVLADRGNGIGAEPKGIVRLLLDRGADVNAEGGLYGSALQAAFYRGNEDIVQLLMDRGAKGTVRMRRTRLARYDL
jgi:ankyrin repeat protein